MQGKATSFKFFVTVMTIVQINLQHCKAASAELSRKFAQDNLEIALIQEPYIYNNKVVGLNSVGDVIYQPGNQKPRTCIVIRRDLNYLTLNEFCTGDETAIKINLKNTDNSNLELVLCSAYFPYDSLKPPPSENLQNLVGFCRKKNLHLLIACDANAHNVAWGCKDTNERGTHVMDFVLVNSLNILNSGNEPTFANAIRTEILDLTLCTRFLRTKISNWHVSDEMSLSDHRYVQFVINAGKKEKTYFRNPKKTEWSSYNKSLSQKLESLNLKINNIQELNIYADKLRIAITSSFEENCPLNVINSNRSCPWYNSHLAELRRNVRKLWNKSKKKLLSGLKNDPIVLKYRQELTNYGNEVKKAKRLSWQERCQEISNTD